VGIYRIRYEMKHSQKKIAIVGAGPMGLTCAYRLLSKGFEVEVFEREDRMGGMSASFDFNGMMIERFYHFICGPDNYTFHCSKNSGYSIGCVGRKQNGLFYNGVLYKWEILFATRFSGSILSPNCQYGSRYLHEKKIDWS
jgi:protoporphyrinogen oxidase